jgi:hypothetical protein
MDDAIARSSHCSTFGTPIYLPVHSQMDADSTGRIFAPDYYEFALASIPCTYLTAWLGLHTHLCQNVLHYVAMQIK